MLKGKYVTLDRVNGRENEYLIKDSLGITAGRVFIIELLKDNRHCTLRIRFYRSEGSEILKEVLVILLKVLFKTKDIYKVSIVVDEYVNTNAFVEIGFSMEGIIEESIFTNGTHKNELLFGITVTEFESPQRINILRLSGNRSELKLLTPEDSDHMLQYYLRNKEHLKPFEPTRDESFYTYEAQKKILMESYKQFLNGTSINCGIFDKGRLVGKIQMSNIVYGIFRSAFIGYSIDKDEQGNGYAKEALNIMLDYAFDDMELHRIEASTLIDNIRSQKVLQGCGFEEVGINKEYLFINGAWRDHITFCKINRC